jgi:hypothetical protein
MIKTHKPIDEQFRKSVLALAQGKRVFVIGAILVLFWLAIFWAEALP